MARTGRPRKNPGLKVVPLTGKQDKNKPDNPNKAKGKRILAPDAPVRPEHLGTLEAQIWDGLVSHLSQIGSLQKCDEGSLVSYCLAYASVIRSDKALKEHRAKHGSDYFTTEGRHGEMIREHPAVKTIERNAKIIAKFATEFGMTPAGRKGLGFIQSHPLLPGIEEFENQAKNDPTQGFWT